MDFLTSLSSLGLTSMLLAGVSFVLFFENISWLRVYFTFPLLFCEGFFGYREELI